MPYSSLAYRGYRLDTSDASNYTFNTCDIGTESPLRAVLVGVIVHGTGVSASTSLNVTVNGYAASRLAQTQSGVLYMSWHIARVPVGTSVTIAVQSSTSALRCGMVWYTFKPNSLSILDVGVSAATATSTSATDVEVTNGGLLFSLGFNSSSGTTTVYNGTDSLLVGNSNVLMESAAAAYLNTHYTNTNQSVTTNDVTSSGVSEFRAIMAISFGTEAKFTDTLDEATIFAETVGPVKTMQTALSDLVSGGDIIRSTPITSYADTLSEAVSGAETYAKVVTFLSSQSESSTLDYFASMTENISASDVIRIRDTLINGRGMYLVDSISTADSLTYAYILGPELIEATRISDLIGSYFKAVAFVTERGRMRDVIVVALPRSVSEAVIISRALGVVAAKSIIERMSLTETLLGASKISLSQGESITLSDALRKFFSGEAIETVAITESLSRLRRAASSTAETIAVTENLTRKLLLRAVAAEGVNLTEAQVLKMIFRRQIAEGVELSAAYISPGDSVTTWAINTRNAAVTEYSNYNFNSFAKLGNKYIGSNATGLYELLGDDDAGADIIAHIKSGFAQFGGSRFTSFKAAYLGMRGNGSFVLKLETGDGKTYNYGVVAKDMETTKVHMGKGLRARYFAFELISTGQDFDLDDIEFVPLVAQRRA